MKTAEFFMRAASRVLDICADALRFFLDTIIPAFRDRAQKVAGFFRPVTSRFFAFIGPRWKKYAFIGSAAVTGFYLIFSIFVFINYIIDRSKIEHSLLELKASLYGRGAGVPQPPIEIFAADKTLIGLYLPERGSRITMKSCQEMDWLRKAAVSSEDRDFYSHSGVSIRGIFRALINNALSFSIREGGGTITQQLARNLFTDHAQTLYRKLYETFTALQAETLLSKEEILCLYLNEIYMGEGRYGADEASWYYFRKDPGSLSAAEAAMIVGLFPSPVRYSPQNSIALSLRKQEKVLEALARDGLVERGKIAPMLDEFKKTWKIRETDLSPGRIGAYGASRDFRGNASPASNEFVRQFLYDVLPEEIVRKGGLKVYTTIDPARQSAALDAVHERVEQVRSSITRAPGTGEAREISERLNGVFIAMQPDTGDIRALVGGYEVTEGGSMVARIWKMRRQPGSALKGFLYAVALDEKVLAVDSEVVDEPINFHGYSPRNAYGKFYGPMPLYRAVALSTNTVAVKTLDRIGVDRYRDRMSAGLDMGFFEARDRFTPNLSLALGSGELTPMELARLYSLLMNGGSTVQPRLVLRIEDKEGEVIWKDSSSPLSGMAVLSPEACESSIALLRSVIDEEESGTAGWIGKLRRKNPSYLPFPVAGKSGTVQSVREVLEKFPGMRGVHDAWFVGIVPGEVGVVWVGHDEGAPFQGSGSGTAGAIWASYAQAALPGRIKGNLPRLPEKEEKPLDPPSQ